MTGGTGASPVVLHQRMSSSVPPGPSLSFPRPLIACGNYRGLRPYTDLRKPPFTTERRVGYLDAAPCGGGLKDWGMKMALVATQNVVRGSGHACQTRKPSAVGTIVGTGALLTLVDTRVTHGSPGGIDSDDALLGSAITWLAAHDGFVCAATQMGYDEAGRPQLVMVLHHTDFVQPPSGEWHAKDGAIVGRARECTVICLVDIDDRDEDADTVLLEEGRSWIREHRDFAIALMALGHDETGAQRIVLAGDGVTFTPQICMLAHP